MLQQTVQREGKQLHDDEDGLLLDEFRVELNIWQPAWHAVDEMMQHLHDVRMRRQAIAGRLQQFSVAIESSLQLVAELRCHRGSDSHSTSVSTCHGRSH